MKFAIDEKLTEKYPDIRIGLVIAAGVDNKGKDMDIEKLLENVQEKIKQNFSLDRLMKNMTIAKWRQVYSSFGSKPSDYRSSVEALIRSVLNGRAIRHINKLVDIYNYISLKHAVPAGGEDLDKVEGDISLKFADGGETFVPLNSTITESPYKGEVVYCDGGSNVLCRRWNWRESDRTKLTEETKNAVVVVEGFDSGVEEATNELSALVGKFCQCKTQTFIADKNITEVEW